MEHFLDVVPDSNKPRRFHVFGKQPSEMIVLRVQFWHRTMGSIVVRMDPRTQWDVEPGHLVTKIGIHASKDSLIRILSQQVAYQHGWSSAVLLKDAKGRMEVPTHD